MARNLEAASSVALLLILIVSHVDCFDYVEGEEEEDLNQGGDEPGLDEREETGDGPVIPCLDVLQVIVQEDDSTDGSEHDAEA